MAKKSIDFTIPSAVFIGLSVLSFAGALYYSAEEALIKAERDELAVEKGELEIQDKALQTEQERLRRILTGSTREFAEDEKSDWSQVFNETNQNVPGFTALLNGQKLPPQVAALLPREQLTAIESAKWNYGSFQNLKQMNRLLTAEAAHLLWQLEEAHRVGETLAEFRVQSDVHRNEVTKQLKSVASELEDQADSWTSRLDTERGLLDDRKDELESLIDDRDKAIKRLQRETKRALGQLETALSLKEDSIALLIEREIHTLADLEADGAIDHVDEILGLAWINLGSKHGLRPGQRFEVFRFTKGAKRQMKGMVEVRKMTDSQAQCIILPAVEMRDYDFERTRVLPAEYDPIIKGDLIRSPFFEAGINPVIVLVGSGLKHPLYRNITDGRQQIERLIEKSGASVDKRVSVHTDFVITMQKPESDEGYQQAVQFGVTFIDEDDIYKFLEP